ncbi:bacterial Ig-like domain-containing protein, partial [Peptoniphilus duerdenii]|uniref:bacterial Ig-like domain-containing protein n=1 Tax=Peptoniphilus duerdenii TaxID=507750 RepID=UPI0023F47806
KFDGWDPALDTNTAIDQDRTIKAQFSAKVFDPEHVEKMVVKTQPTNLTYTEGDKLDLTGLEVTLTDNQGLTKNVAFKDFAANGITTEPKNNKQLTESENNTKIKIKRGDKEAITGNISLTLKVISKADFEKENKIKTSIKNSLVEVYKSLGDIKLGIDNLHNKYYLLFTKESNKIAIEKDNLKTSILNTIKNNKIKSYTIGETNRELLDGENYKSDETILGFIREDILKLAGLEGNPSATDAQILEKLEVTKPNFNIKLVVGDEHIELNYEIIFLSQMTEDKVNQIEADFIKHMEETSLAVQKEDKGFQVSYKDKEYKVLIKPAYKFYDMQELADKCGYDRVLINFFTGENLDTAKSLKNLKSLKIYNKNRYDRISNVVMDSLELKTLLVGKKDFRERTKIYHETFRKPNRGIFAEDLAPGTIRLEYFYTDESSKTGSIITRNIFYKIIN